jgi:alcohol dehydrogenase class IV
MGAPIGPRRSWSPRWSPRWSARSLRAVGLRRDDLDTVAERALGYPPVWANPRPIRTAAEVREILSWW